MPAREGLAEARVSLCCKGPSCAWMGQVRSSTPRQGKRTWSFWDVHPATWNMNCFKLATASILQSQSGVPKVFWLGKQSASREAEMEEQGRLMALVCIIMRNPSISCSVRLHLYNGKLAIAVGHVAVFLQESGLEQTDETPIHLDWVNMVCRLLAAFGVSCLSGHFRCEGMLAPKFT